MRRQAITAREDWQAKVEKLGLLYHNGDHGTWNEECFYEFTADEVEVLETATNELHEMCLEAVRYVAANDLYESFEINPQVAKWIRKSWDDEAPSLYGRFDLSYNGIDPPKLLEYNADTPTTLLEGAVVQWHWLQEFRPAADQFNSIWEGLVESWKDLSERGLLKDGVVHFASADSVEDFMTITALQDTATAAGLTTSSLLMDDIGWDSTDCQFVDLRDRPIQTIFKLYPWEWMVLEPFAANIFESRSSTIWLEPVWKMLLSNKALLPVLWHLFPNSPYILEAYSDGPHGMDSYVKKPLLGREGANVTVFDKGTELINPGEYGDQPYVYQRFAGLPTFDGRQAVIGSWIIDGESRGIGVRESEGPITNNLSPFVPHLFE